MLRRILLIALGVMLVAVWSRAAPAQQPEPRVALVIGNGSYGPGALPTALNDAGLVAEALRSIGFEIVEGGDLGQPDMMRLFRDFNAKVDAAGPDALAFVYFSGLALSYEGETYLLGVDARLARESDIPIEGVRLSDLMRPLADSPAIAKVVMIDATRPLLFRPQGRGLAPGLDAIEAPQGMLIAYSSAPGTVVPDNPANPYGPYATAVAEMLRAPGIDLDTAFTHIRSRTHLTSEGQQTPWHANNIGEQIELVEPDAANAAASVPPPPPKRVAQPMRAMGPDEAYGLAIETDSLDRYVEFVEVYPNHAYSERVWAIIRARREALVWMRAREMNTPDAYWTYLRRYPNGIYAYDAERRLRRLSAPVAPPANFAMLALAGLPLALRNEPREYRPVYRVGPPPPRFFRPPPAFLVSLPPPPPRRERGPGALPRMTAPIPAMPLITPSRRGPPGADRPDRGRPPFPGTATAPSNVPPPGGIPPRVPGGRPGMPPGGPGGSGTATAPSNVPPAGMPPRVPGGRPGMPPGGPGGAGTATAPTDVTPPPGTPPRVPGGRPGMPPGAPGGSGTATAPGNVTPPPTGVPPRVPGGQPGRPPGAPGGGTATAPSNVTPPPGTPPRVPGRPPSGQPGQGGSGTASAPSATTPPPGAPPSGAPPQGRRGPPPGPPPAAVTTPPPPRVASPPPPGRPVPPTPPQGGTQQQQQRQASPPPSGQPVPPPQRPATPPPQQQQAAPPPQQQGRGAPPPPTCPAGKTLKEVAGRKVCA